MFARTMTVNAGSRRVMEKCGLRFVRTFFEDWPHPIEGSDQGDVEYELLRAGWEAARRT
ncbi:GNAT family N-acetyltransferase [Nonomuraea basaltis]|uniref:GNAT family N-acetyltransferase n=1 Tax=Nonomuraea basaltis TaxID=2495887 RepID=UPI001980A055|nr:GNAT family protein [Nonomuraea basaltis]